MRKLGRILIVGLVFCLGTFLAGLRCCANIYAQGIDVEGVVYHSGLSFTVLGGNTSESFFDRYQVDSLIAELLGIDENELWVNLSPTIGSNEVFSPKIYGTKVGQILLEMDYQLKRDVMRFISETGINDVSLTNKMPLLRVWIVPGEVKVVKKGNKLEIITANLNVNIKGLKIHGSGLEKITKRLQKEVNSSARYTPLRQLFRIVIISRFIKQRINFKPVEILARMAAAPFSFYSRKFYFYKYLNTLFSPKEIDFYPGISLLVGGIYLGNFAWEEVSPKVMKSLKHFKRFSWLKGIFEVNKALIKSYRQEEKESLLLPLFEAKNVLSLETILSKISNTEVRNFLKRNYFLLSDKEKKLFRVFVSLSLKKQVFPKTKVPFVARVVLSNSTLLRDFPVMATKADLDFLSNLGLSEVVNLLNFYILGKEGIDISKLQDWAKDFEAIWSNTAMLWEARLSYGFMPIDKVGGKIRDIKKELLEQSSPDVFAVMKKIWMNKFVNTNWQEFYRVYKDMEAHRISRRAWLNFIILSTLTQADVSLVKSSIVKKKVSEQLDNILRERELARKEANNEMFLRYQRMLVDAMKIVGQLYPDLVREKLRYKFEDSLTDKQWEEYREEYERVLGKEKADSIFSAYDKLAKQLVREGKKRIILFNATFSGGGVAEMIPGLYKFFKKYGITLDWYIVEPRNPNEFYGVTKKVHNICQGDNQRFTREDEAILQSVGRDNFDIYGKLINAPDVGAVFFEDPQVLTLLETSMERIPRKQVNYIFRLHIDITGLEHAKKGSGAYNVREFMNRILNLLHEKGGIILFQPYQVPSQWRSKARVYQQPPGIDINNSKNSYREVGHVGEKGTVMYFLNKLSRKIVNTGTNLRLPELWGKPVWFTGARADGWKGILQTIEAYNEFRQRLEAEQGKLGSTNFEIPKLLVVAGGADDDPEVGQVKQKIISLIKSSPFVRDIVFIWNVKGGEMSSLYRLTAEGRLAYIGCSVREGYNLMVEEAARQHCLILTTNAGGLYRFADDKVMAPYKWVVDVVGDPILSKANLEDLTLLDESGKHLVGKASSVLVKKIANKMFSFWSYYWRNPEQYSKDAKLLYARTLDNSLVVMGKQYLSYAVDLAKNGNNLVALPTQENSKRVKLGNPDLNELEKLTKKEISDYWQLGLFVVLAKKAGLWLGTNSDLQNLVGEFSKLLKVFYPDYPDLIDVISQKPYQEMEGFSQDIIDKLKANDLASLKDLFSGLFKWDKKQIEYLSYIKKDYSLATKVAILSIIMDKFKTVAMNAEDSDLFLPILNDLTRFVRNSITNLDLATVLRKYDQLHNEKATGQEAGGIEL